MPWFRSRRIILRALSQIGGVSGWMRDVETIRELPKAGLEKKLNGPGIRVGKA